MRFLLKLISITVIATTVLPITLSTASDGVKKNCSTSLSRIGSLRKQEALRKELAAANLIDRIDDDRDLADFSNFIQGRAVDFDSKSANGGHVISLGSGPDIFLPMYEYPLAETYHLVDILLGWGKGKKDIIREIHARLHTLGNKVTLSSCNPRNHTKCTELKKVSEAFEGQFPLKWQVQWISAKYGIQNRDVFLHSLDFNNPASISKLLDSISQTRKPLGGLVMTGIVADLEILIQIMNAMPPGGTFFAEMNYVNARGEQSDPQSVQILEALSRRFQVTEYPKTVLPRAHQFEYVPNRYVIRK